MKAIADMPPGMSRRKSGLLVPSYLEGASQKFIHKFKDASLADAAELAREFSMTAGRQVFSEGPYVDSPLADLGTLTGTTIEDIWAGITYTPIFANDAKGAKLYRVNAFGTISLTGGTAIITPQWGPAGTSLGASLTVGTVTAAIAAWYLQFDLLVRSVGAAGANSHAVGAGFLSMNGGVSSGTANPNLIVFGGTDAGVDTTINGNVTIRKTLSATNSMIPKGVWIRALN